MQTSFDYPSTDHALWMFVFQLQVQTGSVCLCGKKLWQCVSGISAAADQKIDSRPKNQTVKIEWEGRRLDCCVY